MLLAGMLMTASILWANHNIDQINETEAVCFSLLSNEDLSAEDSTTIALSLHTLMITRISINKYTSLPYSMCAGSFIGIGITAILGLWGKRNELIVSLLERIEVLEKNNSANKELQPTVTTPAESGKLQGTAAEL